MNHIEYFKDVSELTRIISRLKKKYPNAPVISLNLQRTLNAIAVGYVRKDILNLTHINFSEFLTPKEVKEIENKEELLEVIVLGARNELCNLPR